MPFLLVLFYVVRNLGIHEYTREIELLFKPASPIYYLEPDGTHLDLTQHNNTHKLNYYYYYITQTHIFIIDVSTHTTTTSPAIHPPPIHPR